MKVEINTDLGEIHFIPEDEGDATDLNHVFSHRDHACRRMLLVTRTIDDTRVIRAEVPYQDLWHWVKKGLEL